MKITAMLINPIHTLVLNYPYVIAFSIMLIGIFIILYSNNLIKKVIGLNIFQSSIIIFYIAISRIKNGATPIIKHPNIGIIYTNPLPHVLMLTAIVVGIALTAVAFAIIIKIHQNFNTILESELTQQLQNNNNNNELN